MDLRIKNKEELEHGENIGKALIQMIEQILDIKGRKFHIAYTKFEKTSNIRIIYDSEWCRIKFKFSRQMSPRDDELTIQYGRLHAHNQESFIEWQGNLCYCWHHVFEPLRFLDGLSPSAAVQQGKIQKKAPRLVEDFKRSQLGTKLLDEYPPKAAIVMHSMIWEHYGQRLFDLFDLRKPNLWDEYRVFVREYYKLLDMKVIYGPPYENIC